MDDLPAYWTIPFGVVAGCLAIGRTARWIQLLRELYKNDRSATGTGKKRPQIVALLLSTILHPTPWLVAIGIVLGIRRLFDSHQISPQWKWFFVAFFIGPTLIGVYLYFKVQRILKAKAKAAATNATIS